MTTQKGAALIFVAAALFSLGGLCVKMIPWQPLSINSARCIISCCILFAYTRLIHRKFHFSKGSVIGGCCVCGTTTLYTIANKLTTAANTILLQFTAPVFIILFLWLVFHERPKRRDILACLFVFGGIACFFLDGLGTGRMLGNLLAVCSGVSYAWVFMMNKLPDSDPFTCSFLGHLLGAVTGFPWLARETQFTHTALLFVGILGVFQMGVAYICFSAGIQVTPPVTASLVAGIEPILNPTLVAIFVHEMLSGLSVAGGVIVFGTIMVYNLSASRGQKSGAPPLTGS